jgi:hypothetical protein
MRSLFYTVWVNGNFYGGYDSLYAAVTVAENLPKVSINKAVFYESLITGELEIESDTNLI